MSLDDSEYSDKSSYQSESPKSTEFISNIKSILYSVKKPKRSKALSPNMIKKTSNSKSPPPLPSTAARKTPESECPVSLSSTAVKEVLKHTSHASPLYTAVPEVQKSRNCIPPHFLTSQKASKKIVINLKTPSPLIPRALFVKGLSTTTVTPEAAKSYLVSNSSTSVISMKAATNLDPSFSGASTSKSVPSESSASSNGSSQNCLPVPLPNPVSASNAPHVPPLQLILPLKPPTAKSTRDLYLPPYKTRPSQYSFMPLENLKDVENIRTKEKTK